MFGQQLDELSGRMTTAAEAFVRTAAQALADTVTLTETVDTELQGLRSQGASTIWRGANRMRFDGDLTAFHAKLTEATGRMRTFVDEVKTQMSGPIQGEIQEFSVGVRAAGGDAREIARAFNAAVDAQAVALDGAMNQGWSSAG